MLLIIILFYFSIETEKVMKTWVGNRFMEGVAWGSGALMRARLNEVSKVMNTRLAEAPEGESAHSSVHLTELGSHQGATP